MPYYVVDNCVETGEFWIGFESKSDAEFYVRVMDNPARLSKEANAEVPCKVLKAGIFNDLQKSLLTHKVNRYDIAEEVMFRTLEAYEDFSIKSSLIR